MTKIFLTSAFLLAASLPLAATEPYTGLDAFTKSYLEAAPPGNSGIVTITSESIRPQGNRLREYPVTGDRMVANPPIFSWPMADYVAPTVFPAPHSDKSLDDYLRYDFQLSLKPDFSNARTATGLRMAMYNNHAALEPGRWYWRHRVSGGEWSRTFTVDIPEGLPEFVSPTAAEAASMLPDSHPMYYKQRDINPKRMGKDGRSLLKTMRSKARRAFNKTIADYAVKGEEIPADAPEHQRIQILKFRLRYEVEPMCGDLQTLLAVYRIDGNAEYLDKALELARHLAERDPAETFALSDFSGAKCMTSLAEVYDIAADRLSDSEKVRFKEFIATVGRGLLSHCMEENVGSADGILLAHFFQHTYHWLFTTAIAMYHELPEAPVWFEMLYDIWLSRSPGGGYLADGVWPNGNMGYIHVNMESMVQNRMLFKELFGFDTFTHPWYANCADALALVVPAEGSTGDGFGDGSDHTGINLLRPDFAYILGMELGKPAAVAYARQIKNLEPDAAYAFTKANFQEYRLSTAPKAEPEAEGSTVASAVFPQTGIAVMHTNISDAAADLYLSFRSSPFGVGSHGLAEQNSFNISYGGQPLFYPVGYKITTDDRHYLLAHKHSRARNTILADGKTQAYSQNAYGWLPRWLSGEHITYALGDASAAYKPFDISAINWQTVIERVDAYDAEHGYIVSPDDDPKVKRFRRHVALLRPGIVVVYDDLEAEKPVTWTFGLNGRMRSNMTADAPNNTIFAKTDNCSATARIFGSTGLNTTLTDTLCVKPVDWLNPKRGRKAMEFEPNQYTAQIESAHKEKAMRFLAVIRISPDGDVSAELIAPDKKGIISIDGYTITAELDPAKDARLEVRHKQSGETLLAGPSAGAKYAGKRRYTHSTILRTADGSILESADRLPLMANPDETK